MINTKYMLLHAQQNGYAVPAFNIHNLETLDTVVRTAAALRSPVILAATPGTVKYAGAKNLAVLARAAAETYDIPISLHMDHHEDFDAIREGIESGFPSVMMDGSMLAYDMNVAAVEKVVALAHRHGVTVEAELGRLAGNEEHLTVSEKDQIYTNPAQAQAFARETGIDSLAVAVGTAHGLYKSTPKIDFERLSEIRALVTIPLVLHGASNLPGEMVREAVSRGVCKVNVATDLKIAFSGGLKQYLDEHPKASDPREYMAVAKERMQRVAEEKIRLCGSMDRY